MQILSEQDVLYSEVLRMYILRSTILWPNIIEDRNFVNKLNSTVFAKFSDIRTGMHEIFGSIKIPRGQVSLDDLSRDTMFDTATELRELLQKKFDDAGIKKRIRTSINFHLHSGFFL